ncbi:GAF and ANTAR domain-containing protein [Amycolatopsis pittospori]|uniref:GAF and ANTAR domain-containing protein n=1 Tax=Amycolatopsis pittospori TaxID=2749434 RepID=UPI0015F0522E|nr:GAF and ANTAR domain-containing protein [Amycolatopsis pittospori]
MPTTEREFVVAEAVLSLADRGNDFDPLEMLHDLTTHVVALLPVRSAGITILDEYGQVDYVTASDEVCRRLEEDQIELGEGPCVDSARTGTALTPTTLRPSDSPPPRWPRFTPRALRAGITSVAAVPLRDADTVIGALNLMISAPSMPTRHDLRLAQTLADAAVVCLRQRRVLLGKDAIIDQLQTALDSRIVIEQAKGFLAAHCQITVDEAFSRLRSHSRDNQRKLSDLAAQVAQGSIPAHFGPAL